MDDPLREPPDSSSCRHPFDACRWNIYNGRFQCHACGASDLIQVPDPQTTRCAVTGCDYWPVDVRGPVSLSGTYHWVCTEHWEAIFAIVGRQYSTDADRPAESVDA